jgi:methionyl-tRNA formyltransferase
MKNPKIIFAGTPDFAVASLQSLVKAGLVPCAVLTQPDRPAGRGKKLTASPVKQFALDQAIAVMQPDTLKDDAVVTDLAELAPDIIVVAAYGLILPPNVLEIPRAGCLNVHASLLPRWRGAAPIQAAILAGDETSGVSLMSMAAGLDSGPVYACDALVIGERETAGELHDRLAAAGGELLGQHILAILNGDLEPRPQDDGNVTYAPKIRTADAEMDWHRTADELDRHVRAYNPVPGAWFMLDGERIKCWRASSMAGVDAPRGTVVAAGADGIIVSCGARALRLELLQRPGKRAAPASEFVSRAGLVGRRL